MSVAQLTKDYDNLVGDVLVSAGMIAYSGPFTPDFRQKLVKGWQEQLVELGIPHSEGCDVRLTLADPVQVLNAEILPLRLAKSYTGCGCTLGCNHGILRCPRVLRIGSQLHKPKRLNREIDMSIPCHSPFHSWC